MARRVITGAIRTLQERWWTFLYRRCLVGFPWFWAARPAGEAAMVAARRLIRRQFGRDHHPTQRALAQAWTLAAWPLAVLMHLWQIRYFWGPEQVPIRRAPGAIWAAMRHNILPGEYYAYALWQPERRRNIDNYLYSHEAPRLFKLLNRSAQPDPIDDKLAFYEMCKAHALPTPAVLAAFAPTGSLMEFGCGGPPERDLFVKPRVGLAGNGAERFSWRGGTFVSNAGCEIRLEGLGGYLGTRARNEKQTLLVQPVLSNHPDLRVTNAALATARLVTGHTTDGEVVAIFGFMYFARCTRITAQHGRVALIDVASGLLMPLQKNSGAKSANDQVDAAGTWGATTLVLPDWRAALRCAKIAHRACSNIAFVGWDIAFTNQGPMLLEGNANWSADEYQSLTGAPLGHTKFAEILAMHLRGIKAQ
jgi:hypothetical protein